MTVELGMVEIDAEGAEMQESISEFSFQGNSRTLGCVFRAVREHGSPPAVVGRPVSHGFDSSLALEWYTNCIGQHSQCKKTVSGAKPRRLLDLGRDSSGPRKHGLKLVNTTGFESDYVALSHCWGPPDRPRPLMTTQANLSAHLEGIAFESLPMSFQDAVIVAEALGFNYLWVDSLCILQDSISDWETESTHMGDIYANAAFTIAAADARDSHAGFLKQLHSALGCTRPRNIPSSNQEDPLRIVVDLGSVDSSYRGVQIVLEDRYIGWRSNGEPAFLGEWSELDKRGWTLQERLLSSRTLRFSNHEMTFECSQSRRFERLHPSVTYASARDSYSALQDFPKNILFTRLSEHHLRNGLWRVLVEEFSRRYLTYQDDRLAALAGIAGDLQAATGDHYLAGLWQSSLHQDLSWYRLHPLPDDSDTNVRSSNRFPSWSWASCSFAILFEPVEADDIDWTFIRANVDTATNPLGSIKTASLELSGHFNTVSCSQLRFSGEDGPTRLTCELAQGTRMVGKVWMDQNGWPWSQIGAAGDSSLELTFLLHSTLSMRDNDWWSAPYTALILMPVEGEVSTFSRVGLFLHSPYATNAADQEVWPEEQVEREDLDTRGAVEWLRRHGRRDLSLV